MLASNFNYIEHYKKDAQEFDYFEERFGATKDDEKRLREYIISKVPKNTESILDVGCGSAWVAEYFTKKDVQVFSADLSSTNVKIATSKINNNKHFGIVTDSFNPALKKEKFDVIISSEVIEHVANPEKFVQSLYDLLPKKGLLIISTPYKEILRYVLCVHCNQKTPIHAHLHSFDENDFINFSKKLTNATIEYFIFGNKALIFLRTYVLLKYLPFTLWKLIDSIFNKIIKKPAHFIAVYKKN